MVTMAQYVGVSVAVASMAATLAMQPTWSTNLVATLARWTGYNAPGGLWRIAAILLGLANLKSLPFVWHIRIFRTMIYQLYFQPTAIPPHALFQPVVTSTRTTLLEIDYNLHKSNSTYFSDMDISRTALFSALIRNAFRKDRRANPAGATEGTSGNKHMIALGGISCIFKKEILPYKKYEMWTRLLCWDRKWFYLVTHLVKPGVAKPDSWTLQPWKKKALSKRRGEDVAADREKLKGAVYATGIARYVIKNGRITVAPEKALMDADMLPPKPDGWVYSGGGGESGLENGEGEVGETTLPEVLTPEEWNWDVIEKERLRGLKVAEKFAGMDGLHEYFDGGKQGVLGEFPDLLW